MGGLTWLQTLGLALGTGLISTLVWAIRQVLNGNLVPRAVLEREQGISREWKEIALTYAENDSKRSEIVTRNNEILSRIVAVLERAPWLDTVSRDGLRGSTGYAASEESRHRKPEISQQPERWPYGRE